MITYSADKLQKVLLGGGCEQRNLPSGYTQLEYIESTGTQYIDTGVVPNVTTRVVAKLAFPDVNDTIVCWGSCSSGTFMTSLDQFYCGRDRSIWYYSATTRMDIQSNISPNVFYDIDVTNTLVTNVATQSIYLFMLNYSGTAAPSGSSKIAKFKIYDNGIMVRNFIPAKRNSDNVLGMYDTVSQTFFTNAGTGDFIAGPNVVPTPDTPMDIVCNNGVIKVNRNLYSTEYHDMILSQSDGVTVIQFSGNGVNVSGIVDCRTIKSFKITTTSPQGIFRIFKYREDYTFIDANSTANTGDIVTIEDNVGFFRIQYNYTNAGTNTENILIYYSAYSLNGIYTDGTQEVVTDNLGNTANAEMLLSVNDYKDEQSILNGVVTRNIGIKVLDGTEDWSLTGTSFRFDGNTSFAQPNTCLCTHFEGWLSSDSINDMLDLSIKAGHLTNTYRVYLRYDRFTTAEQLKSWLADQYNAGTPVIIVYPLATSTTEQVTSQQLAGSSATVTAGSIDNLPIEISTIAKLKKRYIDTNEVGRVYIGSNKIWDIEDL